VTFLHVSINSFCVKFFADMGADVNAQDSEGKTALHEAVLSGNKPIVEYMLKNGANVHVKTKLVLLFIFLLQSTPPTKIFKNIFIVHYCILVQSYE
jgi:ankyrin repeat protein